MSIDVQADFISPVLEIIPRTVNFSLVQVCTYVRMCIFAKAYGFGERMYSACVCIRTYSTYLPYVQYVLTYIRM